jgi:hypothetical protein
MDAGPFGVIDSFQISLHHGKGWISTSTAASLHHGKGWISTSTA